jgi:hypothetical protein
MLVVALVTIFSAVLSGAKATDFLASVAVILSFGHATVGERMREREAAREEAEVSCHTWLDRYFVAKEVAWVGYFVSTKAWPALLGCGVFLVYPLWRRFWRKRHPLGRKTST